MASSDDVQVHLLFPPRDEAKNCSELLHATFSLPCSDVAVTTIPTMASVVVAQVSACATEFEELSASLTKDDPHTKALNEQLELTQTEKAAEDGVHSTAEKSSHEPVVVLTSPSLAVTGGSACQGTDIANAQSEIERCENSTTDADVRWNDVFGHASTSDMPEPPTPGPIFITDGVSPDCSAPPQRPAPKEGTRISRGSAPLFFPQKHLPRGVSAHALLAAPALPSPGASWRPPEVVSFRQLLALEHPEELPKMPESCHRHGQKPSLSATFPQPAKAPATSLSSSDPVVQEASADVAPLNLIKRSQDRLSAVVQDMENRLLRQGLLGAPSTILRGSRNLPRRDFYDANDGMIDDSDLAALNTADRLECQAPAARCIRNSSSDHATACPLDPRNFFTVHSDMDDDHCAELVCSNNDTATEKRDLTSPQALFWWSDGSDLVTCDLSHRLTTSMPAQSGNEHSHSSECSCPAGVSGPEEIMEEVIRCARMAAWSIRPKAGETRRCSLVNALVQLRRELPHLVHPVAHEPLAGWRLGRPGPRAPPGAALQVEDRAWAELVFEAVRQNAIPHLDWGFFESRWGESTQDRWILSDECSAKLASLWVDMEHACEKGEIDDLEGTFGAHASARLLVLLDPGEWCRQAQTAVRAAQALERRFQKYENELSAEHTSETRTPPTSRDPSVSRDDEPEDECGLIDLEEGFASKATSPTNKVHELNGAVQTECEDQIVSSQSTCGSPGVADNVFATAPQSPEKMDSLTCDEERKRLFTDHPHMDADCHGIFPQHSATEALVIDAEVKEACTPCPSQHAVVIDSEVAIDQQTPSAQYSVVLDAEDEDDCRSVLAPERPSDSRAASFRRKRPASPCNEGRPLKRRSSGAGARQRGPGARSTGGAAPGASKKKGSLNSLGPREEVAGLHPGDAVHVCKEHLAGVEANGFQVWCYMLARIR